MTKFLLIQIGISRNILAQLSRRRCLTDSQCLADRHAGLIFPQRFFKDAALVVLQQFLQLAFCFRHLLCCPDFQVIRQIFLLDHPVLRSHNQSFNEIFHLADISGPALPFQDLEGVRRQLNISPILSVKAFQEI